MAETVAEVMAKFSADTSSMDTGLQRISQEAQDMHAQVEEAGSAFSGLGVVATIAAGIVVKEVHDIIHVTEEWVGMVEQAEIQFGALMGSAAKGSAMVEMLEDLAIKLGTPVQAMLDGSRNMEKFTQGVHGGAEDMKVMADVAAGTGQSISDLSNTVGRYYAMLARGQGGGGGRLGIQLGLSTEQINQLSAMAKQGLNPEQIYGTLIGDLEGRYAGAGEKMATGTMKGIRETFQGLKDQSIGTMLEPLMKGVEEVMNHVNRGLASEGFKRFVADVHAAMESLTGSFSTIGEHVDHFFERFEGHSFQGLLDTVHSLAPALGALAGVLSGLSLGTLAGLPIIGQALAPLAGILGPATAGLLGFLLATKETRESLMHLVGALVDLGQKLAGVGGPIAMIVSSLAPIATLFLDAATAVVRFVASTGPLLAMAKAILEIIIVVKIWNTLGDLFSNWGARLAQVATGHTTAAMAAREQALAEEQLTAALSAQAATGIGAGGRGATGGAANIATDVQAAAATQALVAQSASPVAAASSVSTDIATEVQGLTAAQTLAHQSGRAFATVKNEIEEAGSAAARFGSRAASAVNGLLPVVAALVVGISLVTDSWRKSEASGRAAFEEWSKHNITQGSTESLKGQAERVNQLADAGRALNAESAKYSGGLLAHIPGTDRSWMGAGDAAASKNVAGRLADNKKQYDDALSQYQAIKTNEAQLMSQFGLTQEQVESLAAANHIDLSGALTDVSAKFKEATSSADSMTKAMEVALNAIKAAAANVKQNLAGALGQTTFNLGTDADFAKVRSKLAEIAGSSQAELAPLARNLLGEADAYAKTTHQTTDYINKQKLAFDTANAAADRSYAITQAHQAHQHAVEALAKAHEAYTDTLHKQSQAAISQSDAVNNMNMALSRRSNLYYDLNAKLSDLNAGQEGWGATVESQIAILNADQDAVDGLQRQYNVLSDQLTQVNDAMKVLQDTAAHPLQGEGAMAGLIEANKMAQDAVKARINALLLSGAPSADPRIANELEPQLQRLTKEGEQLAIQNELTFGHQKFLIEQVQKPLERSFTELMNNATAIGQLKVTQDGLNIAVDQSKGPLDAANARLRDQKTITDSIVGALNNVISTNVNMISSNRAVQNGADALRSAEEGVINASHGIAMALRAVQGASYDSALAMNTAMDSTLSKIDALIARYYNLIALEAQAGKTAWDAATIFSSVFGNITGQALISANIPGTREYDLTHLHAAQGAYLKHFAAGGMENHMAQIARQGSPTRIWNEPETGGEAYIPLDPSKRVDAMGVLGQVMDEFGVGGGGTRGVTISDGAVQIHIEIAGDAPAGLAAEVANAVEEALANVATSLITQGGSRRG